MRGWPALLFAALILAGCQSPAPLSSTAPPPPALVAKPAVQPSAQELRAGVNVDNTERMRGYVKVREYYDRWPEDGVEVHRRVEYGYDYDRATTVQRVYDLEGRLIASQALPLMTLAATEAELDRITALARAHPDLAEALSEPDLFMHGGFAVMETDDPHCAQGSRCLRLIVSADAGYRDVAHAVVDLVTDRVVYPFYVPNNAGNSAAGEELKP